MINRLLISLSFSLLVLLLTSCSGVKEIHQPEHASLSQSPVLQASPLQECAQVFIDSQPNMAPTVYDSSPLLPYGNNLQLCYPHAFALEYWTGNHSPRWAAFTLPLSDNMLTECSGEKLTEERFHVDAQFPENNLTADSYQGSDFVPELLVPELLFEGNPCAQYHARVLTNVTPQHQYLQPLWHELARQIQAWAKQSSKLYVVTGNAFQNFPYQAFEEFEQGKLNKDKLILGGTRIAAVSSDPASLNAMIKDDTLPTAYFALLYRPEQNGISEQMIGFLLPHTQQDLKLANDSIWSFVAPLETIETTSDVYFPGLKSHIDAPIKSDWFFKNRSIRSN
ncbi:DNA/RNA non-specific endonuclease [Paraneptunicella aestuarii]|uniref:DNA/RNA non-specific endonuclease n=1 Tax=Paraneptunicella aestuarii TaxID=2831148 RepID=UPI001E3FDB33|nr:DNA/RNA non-specific endonuclease [Paraneptunicella aestuarii]UAA40600.1 DNA/RNA non-specific endonuclease [Paraneptunicella aestuarii]